MKKIVFFLLLSVTLLGCKDETECCANPTTDVVLKFSHHWDGVPLSNLDFNEFKFTTENGEEISIERYRYVISNINIIGSKNHFLIDLASNSETEISITELLKGTTNLNFTFGFSDDDNVDGIYKDLNQASFNVPAMLGGGYHYMQFDGKYKDTNNQDANFNYHAIRAVDRTDPNNLVFEDTSFEVDLGTVQIGNNTIIEINVNIAEWFKNPTTWNLNELNTVLMPNFEAQKIMSANGKNVFSLGNLTSN